MYVLVDSRVYVIVYMLLCYVFFFFKQKTAYEMRISDWSSDVCSSDLRIVLPPLQQAGDLFRGQAHARYGPASNRHFPDVRRIFPDRAVRREPAHARDIVDRFARPERLVMPYPVTDRTSVA